MKVCELFTSIQGESTYAGLPCTFIRLSGCNLRCLYCDTLYAFEEGRDMQEDEILDFVRAAGLPLVELTGGEPLMQGSSVLMLMKRLLDEGYAVLLETNGSYSVKDVDRRAAIILDVKTPGSGMEEDGSARSGAGEGPGWLVNDPSNFAVLKKDDEVKFVITGRADYEWSKDMIERYALASVCKVLFSPAPGMLEPRELVKWILDDRLPVRLNLQLHKIIFGAGERGV